jgi:hypothetical protein
MTPFIRDGNILTLAQIGDRHLTMGEIVAYLHSGRQALSVHRIIGIRAGEYKIQGDNLGTGDGWIHRRHILARVVSVERCGRRKRLGLGIERFLIAALQRRGLLGAALAAAHRIRQMPALQARSFRKSG